MAQVVTEQMLLFSNTAFGNASTARHGLLPKLSGSSTDVLKGDGTWAAETGSGSSPDVVVDHGTTGATETIDVTLGDWHRMTLDANCTITVSGYTAGIAFVCVAKITQDGVGGHTIIWDPDVLFLGDSTPDPTASTVSYYLLWADAGDSAIYAAKIGPSVTESSILLSDVTTDNVTSTAHGFAPKSPADAAKFLNGAATPAYAQVKDTDLSTSDVTTNDVSAAKHGFVPKAPNTGSQYLRDDVTWQPVSSGQHILIADGHATPFVFTDLLQMEDSSDFMWSD